MNLKYEPGWTGAFTRDQYPGALPSGTRVWKVNSEPGDGTADGMLGRILGSIGHPTLGVMYFVEWHGRPQIAVAVAEKKVARVQ